MNVPEVKESHVQGSKDNEYTDGLNNNNEQSGSSRNDTSKNVNESVTRKGLEEKGHLSLDEESNLGNSKCQLLDSGHFTISPETEQSESAFSGSPRSHSPPCEVIHTQTSMSQMYPSSLGYSEASDTEGLTHEEIDSICTSMKSGRPASSCTSSVSMSAYRPGSANYGESAEYLRTALNNFNAMYEEKLKIIEDIRAQGDAVAKESLAEKRAHILECWAKDVSVQNIVLIHTVEELEKQSEQKLIQLQKKLKESTNIAQMHHSVIHKYESKIKTLMTDKETSEVEYKALQRDLEKLRSDFKKARDRCRILEKDNENLVTLILRIRDMGVWDTAGLQLWRKTYEQIFGLYPNLPGSEVQTVFTREKAKKIKETEEKAEQLENEVVELEAQREVTAAEILNKDSKISELAEELKMVCTKLQNCQTECEHYKKSLIETQEQLLEATKELQVLSTEVSKQNLQASKDSNRQSEIHELLREIRDMKSQLNLSVDEHLSAKEENHLIRKEVSERLQAMCESQQCLHSELSHTIEAKHQVQEKEMELMKTREQMQLYQTKYNSAEQQLATKDQLIEELQKQIVHLNGKGSSSKCGHGHKHVSQPFPRCSRDATSHKTDKDLPSPEENSKTKVMYDRPPWNHHFVKEELLRSKSTLSFNSSGLNFSTNPTPKSSSAVDEKKECDKGLCSSSNEKCRQAYNDAKHSKTQLNLEESTYSFCSCAEIDPSGTCSSPLLPLSTSDENVKRRKKLNYTEEPLNMPEPKRNQKSTSKTQLIGSLAKDKVSVANKASYGLLMDVVVGTSKKFLEASKDLDPQHCLSSIKIIASHSKRKNGLEGEMRTASTEQLKLNLEHRDKCESSTSMEQILSQLPEQTNFNGVTEWIAKSQSSQSKSATKLTTNKQEASRMTKTPEGFGKKTASKIPKPTKPKLSPRRPSPPTRAKKILVTKPQDITDKNNTDNPKLTSKISNIKEEWNRVFSHFNSNNGEEVDGGSYVKDSSESLNSEKVSLSEHCTEEAFMPGGCVVTVRRESSTNLSPDSDEYKRIVDLARKDFEAEKHRIEEEHRKVMKDKDIEITMQKGRPVDNVKRVVRVGDGIVGPLTSDSGCGSVCLGDLMQSFDELKTSSLDNLRHLKDTNSQLVMKSSWMEKKLVLFSHLIAMKDVIDQKGETRTVGEKSTLIDTNVAVNLEREVMNMKNMCKKLQQEFAEEAEAVESLTKLDETLRLEIAELHWQLERFKSLASELESELVGVRKDLSELQRDNTALKKEKEKLEEKLLAKLPAFTVDHPGDEMLEASQGYTSPFKRLFAMKKAFDINEKIILKQKADIKDRNELIDTYHRHCENLQKVIEALNHKYPVSEESKSTLETRVCLKQHAQALHEAREAQEKVAWLTKMLADSTTENLALKKKISLVQKDIDELVLHTDKERRSNIKPNAKPVEASSFPACRLNLIQTKDDIPNDREGRKGEGFAVDHSSYGSGDAGESSRVYHVQMSHHFTSGPVPSNFQQQQRDFSDPRATNGATDPNLQSLSHLTVLMGKCAEDIGRSSSEIISSAMRLNVFNVGNTENVYENRDQLARNCTRNDTNNNPRYRFP